MVQFLCNFDRRRERSNDQCGAKCRAARARERFVDDESDQNERDDAVEFAQENAHGQCAAFVVLAEELLDQRARQRVVVDAMAQRGPEQDGDDDDRERGPSGASQDWRNTSSVSVWRLPPLTGAPAGTYSASPTTAAPVPWRPSGNGVSAVHESVLGS